MGELISLIVPVYKVEKYLSRCIESILEQTYKEIEIILVDDGSPDSCPEICDNYASRDKRIQVIHKRNGGLSDARNAGIEAARGEYLGFIDSDDYIHPAMYMELWKAIQRYEADVAMCDIQRVDGEGGEACIVQSENVRIYSGRKAVENILDKNLHVVSVVSWGKLYRRRLFEGIRFPVGRLHEDEFTTYQLFYRSSKVAFIEGRYYYYFQRPDSIMGKLRREFSTDGLEAYRQMGEFFRIRQDEHLLYLVKYKYLYMLKEASTELKKDKKRAAKGLAGKLDEEYRREYRHYIRNMQEPKRKARLWLYRWFGISI